MPIPRKRVNIDLIAATPTPLTVDALKAQLTAIGLTCKDSDPKLLVNYITDVTAQIAPSAGSMQTYAILKPVVSNGANRTFAELAAAADAAGTTSRLANTLADSSVGNWEPDPTGDGYGPELEYIQYESHFLWLKGNRPSFTGVLDNQPTYQGKYESVEAIKALFVEVGKNASSTLVTGLDLQSIESVLSNAIAPLSDANAKNYDVTDSRVIFLVDNYDPQTRMADGIGVLTVWWHLRITDYKQKKESTQHQTTLNVRAWSVLYGKLEDMENDYKAAYAQFGGK
ncbi:MAG TPA: hypothetical protein VFW38_03945 [Solirubrobacteraceae bacterium]|nr:hypothetical protein [Solirubrobacteraceae bacterium]